MIVEIENIIHNLEIQLIYLKYEKFNSRKVFAEYIKDKPFYYFFLCVVRQ